MTLSKEDIMPTKYYAVVEDLYGSIIIWGTGKSKTEAKKDAVKWITEWVKDNNEDIPRVDTLAMSEEAFEQYTDAGCGSAGAHGCVISGSDWMGRKVLVAE